MKPNFYLFPTLAIVMFGLVLGVAAQKKKRLGRVCGDPTLPCKSRDSFQPYELPFDTGKNAVIAESEFFYAIVLKSAQPTNEIDCEKSFPELERLPTQDMFPDHKVFALRCEEPGSNYYTGIKSGAPFLAVYAGRTLTEANKFLKTVEATRKFPGVKLRRMKAGINGT